MTEGRPWHHFKDKMHNAFEFFNLSHAFGWTPKQIRELDIEDYFMYISILKGIGQAEPTLEK